MAGTARAREIAGVDAAGAAIGSVGLVAFSVIVGKGLSRYSVFVVLVAAT